MCGVVNSGVEGLHCEYIEAWEPGDLEGVNSGVEDFNWEAGSSMHSAEAKSGLSEAWEPGDLEGVNSGVEDFNC